jgi:hypothetical protein
MTRQIELFVKMMAAEITFVNLASNVIDSMRFQVAFEMPLARHCEIAMFAEKDFRLFDFLMYFLDVSSHGTDVFEFFQANQTRMLGIVGRMRMSMPSHMFATVE